MIKVSELVRLREQLEKRYDTTPIADALDGLKQDLENVGRETEHEEFGLQITDISEDINRLHDFLRLNEEKFGYLMQTLDDRISKESMKFLTENYDLEIRVESEALHIIRNNRRLDITPETAEEIITRIRLHTSWKYPALEIGCRDGEYTKYLVAGDPLYITDHYPEFLVSAVKDFNEDYQRRVRTYLTKDHNMKILPQGVFGFVFSWNFLNYRSLDSVKEYIKSVWELLRPGGVFLFSYNNGDLSECVSYAESRGQSYIPRSMVVPMCESLGFDINYARDVRGPGTTVSWLEICKPGQLQTIRAHQTMGEICPRTDTSL